MQDNGMGMQPNNAQVIGEDGKIMNRSQRRMKDRIADDKSKK